jgi:hypothetical protein
MNIDTNGHWKLYWGNMPLPQGTEAVGTIDGGALILLQSGVYVRGNAGAISNLDQTAVKKELGLPVHGGKRAGAGRPETDRKQRNIQASDAEWELIKAYADKVRGK